jgi:hypothetical protein
MACKTREEVMARKFLWSRVFNVNLRRERY